MIKENTIVVTIAAVIIVNTPMNTNFLDRSRVTRIIKKPEIANILLAKECVLFQTSSLFNVQGNLIPNRLLGLIEFKK